VRTRTNQRIEIKLGAYGSADSQARYREVLALLAANQGRWPGWPANATTRPPEAKQRIADDTVLQPDPIPPPANGVLTINDLLLQFLRDYLELKRSVKETALVKRMLRLLKEEMGGEPVVTMTPKRLRALRLKLVQKGWCRNVVNRQTNRLRLPFVWGARENLFPPEITHALMTVRCLKPTECGVRDTAQRQPAFWAEVQKVAPHCTPAVGAMLQLQWLTGCRSGEIRALRVRDLNRSDSRLWVYRPGSSAGRYGQHKNAWRGPERIIHLGPQAIAVLAPWLAGLQPGDAVFSPAREYRRRMERARANRQTKVQPSQQSRANPAAKRRPGELYTTTSYPQAVATACRKAGVKFHPYALRHGRKMDVARSHGLEAARLMLGQKSIEMTQQYGVQDHQAAANLANQVG
jgi:integrase